jgi:hypothetical protein
VLAIIALALTAGVVYADGPAEEPAPAEEVDPDAVIDDGTAQIDEDPAAAVSLIVEAFRQGHWSLAIGTLVLFVVWVLRRFLWTLIPRNVLPWLTLALAMVVTVVVGLIAGVVWWQALIDGLLTSGVAMAFWSLVFRHLLPKPDKD